MTDELSSLGSLYKIYVSGCGVWLIARPCVPVANCPRDCGGDDDEHGMNMASCVVAFMMISMMNATTHDAIMFIPLTANLAGSSCGHVHMVAGQPCQRQPESCVAQLMDAELRLVRFKSGVKYPAVLTIALLICYHAGMGSRSLCSDPRCPYTDQPGQ